VEVRIRLHEDPDAGKMFCYSPVAGFAALVVEGRVWDEGGDVDVPHAVQQQAEILGGETVQRPGRQHVKQPWRNICRRLKRIHLMPNPEYEKFADRNQGLYFF